MRSYVLAIAVAMLLSSVYAFQNSTDITVRFLMFSRTFPQGVWEVILFSIGAVLMWVFSIMASFELRSKHRKEIKDRDERLAELEEEKKSLLSAFRHISPSSDPFEKPDEHVAHVETESGLYESTETAQASSKPVEDDETSTVFETSEEEEEKDDETKESSSF